VAVLGGVEIYISSGHVVDPFFYLSPTRSIDGWWKVWLYLRNDADALLRSPCSQVASPSLNPSRGTKWLGGNLCRLQPMREVIQQLLHEGLMGVDLF
jgi:hypothetical protein